MIRSKIKIKQQQEAKKYWVNPSKFIEHKIQQKLM